MSIVIIMTINYGDKLYTAQSKKPIANLLTLSSKWNCIEVTMINQSSMDVWTYNCTDALDDSLSLYCCSGVATGGGGGGQGGQSGRVPP